jgi:hypothetical protein
MESNSLCVRGKYSPRWQRRETAGPGEEGLYGPRLGANAGYAGFQYGLDETVCKDRNLGINAEAGRRTLLI